MQRGLGTHKMGEASDIPYNVLRTIDKNRIRLETLHAANNRVSECFSKLSIYESYHLAQASPHFLSTSQPRGLQAICWRLKMHQNPC